MNGPEHTLSILVRNVPGVLSKIAGIVFRHGNNIETLTVGKTHQPGVSKIVVSVHADTRGITELRQQLNELLDVHSAEVLDDSRSLQQEVCLIRVGFDSRQERMAIMATAQPYRPTLRGVEEDAVILEVADVPGLIDDFVAHMQEYRIQDVSRTGMTALGPAVPVGDGG